MKTTTAKKNKNVVTGTVSLQRRLGHLSQRSARFKSNKQYDRRVGKAVE